MPIIRQVADEHGASVIMVEQHMQLASRSPTRRW